MVRRQGHDSPSPPAPNSGAVTFASRDASFRLMLLSSRQAAFMTDNDSYAPNSFVADGRDMSGAGSGDKSRLPQLVEISRRAAEEFTADSIADPRDALSDEAAQRAAFEARLEARWGRSLDLADLVVHEAYEAGRWVNDLLGPTAEDRQDEKFEALIRLHGKGVMTAREVLVLLRSGYSSGALARWRTLHEVWVVFLVLADGDRELSRRYLAHEIVESLKGQEEYEAAWKILGHEPPDWSPAERDEARAELAKEFGPRFLKDYGWAAPLFGDKRPTFKELQRRVEMDPWRGYYRLASHGTHAHSMGLYRNVQDLGTSDVIWAGPSDVGLVDPAQCSLIALEGLTAGLMAHAIRELPGTADHRIADLTFALVRQQAIRLLVERAIESLVEVHAKQETEAAAAADLVERAEEVLQSGAPMTAEDLATKLNVDLEDPAEALRAAVARGEVLQETHYRINAASMPPTRPPGT